MHKTRWIFSALLVFVGLSAPLRGESQSIESVAQLWPLDDSERFTDRAVLIDFQEYEPFILAEDLLEAWGITFTGEAGGAHIWSVLLCPPPGICPPGQNILSNDFDQYRDLPLIIESRTPLHRIGFMLVPHSGTYNNPRAVAAKTAITAFDEHGRLLGSIVKEGTRIFAGLESVGAEGIARVEIKSDQGIEGIDDLILDYYSRPQFKTCLPQLAEGGGLHSSITFLNLSDSTAKGTMTVYGPLRSVFHLTVGENIPLELPPRGSKTLVTGSGAGELKTGHAVVTSDCPLQVQTVYTTRESDGTVREAGVVSTRAGYRSLGAVVKDVEKGIDTAIAVSGYWDVDICLISSEAGFPEIKRKFTIPDAHFSKFISELFPELEGKDFHGTVRVSSGSPVAVMLMHTLHGVATASFPSGRY